MRFLKSRGFLGLLFLWVPLVTAGAFTSEARFLKIGTAQGLPNGSVSSLVQDSRGFLWMGTQGGLARWDGYSFKIFENEPFQSNVLSHNQIQTLFLDQEDILWIGTYGGLNRFDLKTHDFKVYKNHPAEPKSLGQDLVIAIARDASGRLWAGTQNGLYRLDESTGEFTAYLPDPSRPSDEKTPGALPGAVVRSLLLDHQGRFWVGTSTGGLSLYVPEAEGFRTWRNIPGNDRSLPSNAVMALSEDSQGLFWIGCWGGGLVSSLDPATGVFKTYPTEDLKIYTVNAQDSSFVRAGSWGGGLFELNRYEGTMARYLASDTSGALSNDVVYCMLQDVEGDFWVGTNGGGINRMSRNEGYYETLAHDSKNPHSLGAGKVTSVLRDRNGTMWVGVYNGGLNRYVESTRSFVRYRNDLKNPHSIPNDIVNYLYEDSRGTLWVATNNGLARYRPRTDDFETWPLDSLPDNIFYSLKEHPDGRLWLGMYTKGLGLLDPVTKTFQHFPLDPEGKKGPRNGLIYAMEYDNKGNLWLGTNLGLSVYDGNNFTSFSYDPTITTGLSSDTIRTLFKDEQGNMWLGTTGGGLLRSDPGKSNFTLYSRASGLPSNNIRLILQDREGSIWAGTSAGLAVKKENEEVFRGLTVFNELQDRDFHTGAWRAGNGDLYFGGANVLYRLNPRNLPSRSVSPRVELSGLLLGASNKDHPIDPAYLTHLNLPYDANGFSVEFTVMDYHDPVKNLYNFYLEGFDSTWRSSFFKRRADYTNLPGGKYTLHVKGSNADGNWTGEERILTIEVDSPPWAQPWAYAGYLGILTGFGYLLASLKGKKTLTQKVVELTQLKGELETVNEKLQLQTRMDGLTGIPNRLHFDEYLIQSFARALRDQQPLGLIMIDLDHFKDFNDQGGHLKGDEALRQVASALHSSLERATDLAARYGGEEFVVVLPGTTQEGVRKVAERLRTRVESLGLKPLTSSQGGLTISLGITTVVPQKNQSPLILIEKADKALYTAKERGRNRVECLV